MKNYSCGTRPPGLVSKSSVLRLDYQSLASGGAYDASQATGAQLPQSCCYGLGARRKRLYDGLGR